MGNVVQMTPYIKSLVDILVKGIDEWFMFNLNVRIILYAISAIYLM